MNLESLIVERFANCDFLVRKLGSGHVPRILNVTENVGVRKQEGVPFQMHPHVLRPLRPHFCKRGAQTLQVLPRDAAWRRHAAGSGGVFQKHASLTPFLV